jgi:transposase InsO family protein/DNA-binding XRE family transcriptional regulator
MHPQEDLMDQRAATRMAMTAGIIQAAFQLRALLKIGDLSGDELAETLGVSRSQLYSLARTVRSSAENARGPGRPPRAADWKPAVLEACGPVCMAVRDWLADHPGAIHRVRTRMHYSGGFRDFVVRLLEPTGLAHGLTLEQAATAIGLSRHTLAHWLSGGRAAAQAEPAGVVEDGEEPASADGDAAPPAETAVQADTAETVSLPEDAAPADTDPDANAATLPTSQWAAVAAQIIALWEQWEGGFLSFCRSLSGHGIHVSVGLVRSILALHEKRPRRTRRDRHPDPEAVRGEMARLFPNAQWNADGKTVLVEVGDRIYRFTWELVTDNATTAHLGFAIRDNEDSTGLLQAVDQAKTTAGEPPLALLRDPRKCNTAADLEEALEKDNVLSMFSGVGRPRNNAQAENGFSLFAQKMPPIHIPDGLTEPQFARLVLWYVLIAYCAGRNATPRRRLRGKTPAEAYADSAPSDEEKARALEYLAEVRRRIEEEADADRRRCRPAVLELLRAAFAELGLSDPAGRFIPAIARYGHEAALEALAIYRAKRDAGTEPDRNRERYLLGIARHVAYRNEDQRTYEYLLDLRSRAGDLILAPLDQHDAQLRSTLPQQDYRTAVLGLALDSQAAVDRVFWRRRFLLLFQDIPAPDRQEQGRLCARRIACRTTLPHRERDYFISLLAEATMPLAV